MKRPSPWVFSYLIVEMQNFFLISRQLEAMFAMTMLLRGERQIKQLRICMQARGTRTGNKMERERDRERQKEEGWGERKQEK